VYQLIVYIFTVGILCSNFKKTNRQKGMFHTS